MSTKYLYVISALSHKNGPCKIGMSQNPNKRMTQLQTAYPEKLNVWYTEEVDVERCSSFEKMIHKDIKYKQTHGEWFNLSVEEAIAHLQHTIIYYDSKIKKKDYQILFQNP